MFQCFPAQHNDAIIILPYLHPASGDLDRIVIFCSLRTLDPILRANEVTKTMSLRRFLGYSDGEVMRSDAKPCSRLMRHTAGIFSVGGALGFWVLCRMHYGPRVTIPRSLRWAACGAVTMSSSTALLVRLFSPECEPQNIAAYDIKK